MAYNINFGINNLRPQEVFDQYDMSNNYGMPNPFQSQPNPTPTFPTNTPQFPTQNSAFQKYTPPESTARDDSSSLRMKALFDSLSGIYTPETHATERLNNLLDNMPQMNKPGLMRKIVASGAALGQTGPGMVRTGGGPDAADRILYAPYLQQMAAFKEKAGPFQSAATLENQQNINERQLAGNLLTTQTAADRNAEIQRRNEDLARIADEKNSIARTAAEAKITNDRRLADIKDYKNKHPEVKWDTRGSTVLMMDETGVHDTGLPTSHMSDFDKAMMEGGIKMAVQGLQNEGNANTANIRAGAAAVDTPAETAKRRVNTALAIIAAKPELAPYIKVENNEVRMTRPSAGLFGGVSAKLQKDFDDAADSIFQSQPTINGAPVSGAPSNAPKVGDRVGNYSYERNPQNHNEQRRTLGDGKYEYSHDGGVTWGAR